MYARVDLVQARELSKKHFPKVSYHKNEMHTGLLSQPTSPRTTKRWPDSQKCQVTTTDVFKM